MYRLLALLALLLPTFGMGQARLYPSAAKAPKKLLVLNMQGSTDFEERCLVSSAQGLYNSRPNATSLVYIEWSPGDEAWLPWLKAGYVSEIVHLKTVADLVSLLPRGAVLYNQHPSQLADVATTFAGCERLLLAGSPEVVKKYRLVVKANLSDRFQTNAEAYRWVWARCQKSVTRKIASFTSPYRTPVHNPAQLRDYLIANRIFTFWISGDLDQKTIGANRQAEELAVGEILGQSYPANIPVLGYPWSGDGYGPGEGDGVGFLSRLGKFLVPTDNFTNLSVWTAFPPSKKSFPAPPPAPSLDKDATYAALVMSDGDNLCTYNDYWPTFWKGLKDRSVPVGWTMGPTLRELAPPIFDYAVSHLPSGHSVGSGVSGVGYMAIDQFAKGLSNPGAVLDTFAKMTEQRCLDSGERWLWVMRYGAPYSPELIRYVGNLKSLRTVMGGYGRITKNPATSIEQEGPVTVFHCALEGNNPDEVIPNLDAMLAKPNHPRFFQIFLMAWGYKPDDLDRLIRHCQEKGIRIVTPEQLGSLERASR